MWYRVTCVMGKGPSFTRGTEHFDCSQESCCSEVDCNYTQLFNTSFTVFSYYGGHDSSWTCTETNQSQSQTKNGSPCWSVWQRYVRVLLIVRFSKLRPIFLGCWVVFCCNFRAWGLTFFHLIQYCRCRCLSSVVLSMFFAEECTKIDSSLRTL